MEKKRILLLDMYGVIIKESKGYFSPYTFEHFDRKEHSKLTRAFREEWGKYLFGLYVLHIFRL